MVGWVVGSRHFQLVPPLLMRQTMLFELQGPWGLVVKILEEGGESRSQVLILGHFVLISGWFGRK